MYRYKIDLVTMTDITEFVDIATNEAGNIKLIDDTGLCVKGKSLLGVIATVEWNSLYCVSADDIYTKISKFCV